MTTTIDALRQNPLFADLRHEHLELLAASAVDRHVRAGEHVFIEGEPAGGFLLIRAGAIALELDTPGRRALVVETLHDGDVVGWSWLFAPHRWQFDGRATEPTDVIAFDGTFLREACTDDHELGYELMRRFAGCMLQRLQAARIRLVDIYGHAAVA